MWFITGIGTDVGKTVASAIVVKALGADYWKPIQCGDLDNSDSLKVQSLTGCAVHPEAYRLQLPMSPHAAAEAEGMEVTLDGFRVPKTDRPLVVEGAGGLLVPLNARETVLDLIQSLAVPVILVSRHYLGSINHTLLSLEVLSQRGVPVAGILFNGEENPSTESVIVAQTGVSVLGRIPVLSELSPGTVAIAADQLRERLLQAL